MNHHHIKGFEASNKEGRRLICIYCSAESHLSSECHKAKTIQERKDIFKKGRFVTIALVVINLLPPVGGVAM